MILRPGTSEDASACGVICFEALKVIASEHNFPWAFPSAEGATGPEALGTQQTLMDLTRRRQADG